VALGRTSYVQATSPRDVSVVPFKIALPTDAGFYLVSPEGGQTRRSSSFSAVADRLGAKQGLDKSSIAEPRHGSWAARWPAVVPADLPNTEPFIRPVRRHS